MTDAKTDAKSAAAPAVPAAPEEPAQVAPAAAGPESATAPEAAPAQAATSGSAAQVPQALDALSGQAAPAAPATPATPETPESDAPPAPAAGPESDFSPSCDAPRIDPSAFPESQPEEKPSVGERAKDYAREKTPEKLKNPSDLQIRVRTGIVYIAVTTLCLVISNITTALMLSVTAALCAGELFYMLRHDAKLPNEALGIIAAALYPLSMLIAGVDGPVVVTLAFMLTLVVWYVFWQRARFGDVAISFFGAMYTGMLLSCGLFIRMQIAWPWGGIFVLGIFTSIWVCDGFAYLTGRKFGKHKMAPHVSPKKTWEGFIGGELGCVLVWVAMSFVPGVNMSILQAIIFGIIVGVAGVLGDLMESRIKRNSGVKDSGTLMPGHGGLLDRSDSMFIALVVSAVLLHFCGCI